MAKETEVKLKEIIEEQTSDMGKEIETLKEEIAVEKEANAKKFEEQTELKAQFDALQGKIVTLQTKSAGEQKYVFLGYDNQDMAKNFQIGCTMDQHSEVSKMVKLALTSANTGEYAIPVEYANSLLGLAELQSYALGRCRVITYPGEIMYMPTKGTRATSDAQAYGTANADAAITLGRITFTIDKRIGSKMAVYNNVLKQANFDFMGQFVNPAMVESIYQTIDGEFIEKTEFTSSLTDGATATTFSGGFVSGTTLTYDVLMDLEFGPEMERGLNLEWIMSRSMFKEVKKIKNTLGDPIWDKDIIGPNKYMIDGYPVFIVPEMSTPAACTDGKICMAFGDPQHFILAKNEELLLQKEDITQMDKGITNFYAQAVMDGNIVTSAAWSVLKRSD